MRLFVVLVTLWVRICRILARGSRRRVSDSAGSSSRRGFTDDEIHMLSCSLLSQRRGPRRAFLEATDSSTRRRLIAECKAIHARVQDSCIEYTPEVCWALMPLLRMRTRRVTPF